jgi:arabinogalactan endo-1,4-beta-galactosidase
MTFSASCGFSLASRCFRLMKRAWVIGVAIAAACPASAAAPERERPFLFGADVSALATHEAHGAVYRRHGAPGDALRILTDEGINCFRLRLFVAPNHEGVVTNDLAYTLALAKRVKAAGAALLLDLHYSDTWADPGKQFKPVAWAGLSFDELEAKTRDYTRATLERFIAEGVAPDYVQLGNEITNGFLWPDGRVEFKEAADKAAWVRLGRLLRAAHAGLADAFPRGARPASILQVENPGERERSLWFCREAIAARVPFDVIGMSYYPEWHGGIGELRGTLQAIAREFHRPVMVVETAYPWTKDEHWIGRPHLDWPLTPAGQARFMRDVLQVVRELPDGLGRGVFVWHPESILADDLTTWFGGSCAWFDRRGEVLPAAGFARASAP